MSTCKHEPPVFTTEPSKDESFQDTMANWDRYYNPAHREWVRGNLHVLCPYRNCQIDICQYCGIISSGMGPILCPCDHTRGWKAKRVESMGKPFFDVKVRGRYRGKADRRRREMKQLQRRLKQIEGRLVSSRTDEVASSS